MELDLSGEQEQLRTSVREVLERECPTTVVRDLVERGTAPSALWSRMVELGWPALALPEDVGGLGLGFVELAVVIEELGRRISPGPFLATVTQLAPLVRLAGTPEQARALLGPVVGEGRTGTVAVTEDGARWAPDAVATTAQRAGSGWVLRGRKAQVLDAATADEVAVVAHVEGAGLGVFVVPGAELPDRCTATGIDLTRPWGEIGLDGVHVPPERALGEPGTSDSAVAQALEESTVALAIETVGVCAAAFETTLAYAKVREQFGVPIGSFQAVKHRLADLHVAIERARATAYFAALAIAEDDPRRAVAASMAKVAAGECQRLVAQDAVQLLGGIGYTWEHDQHLWVKRAKSGEALLGGTAYHRQRIADFLGLTPSSRSPSTSTAETQQDQAEVLGDHRGPAGSR